MNFINRLFGYKPVDQTSDDAFPEYQTSNDMLSGPTQSKQNTSKSSLASWFSSTPPTFEQIDLEMGGLDPNTASMTNEQQQQEQDNGFLQRSMDRLVTFIQPHLPKFPEMSYLQRLSAFSLFAVAGLFLLFYTFMLLPRLFLGGAAKFALAYTFSNIFIICSTFFIVDLPTQLRGLFSKDRRLITITYFSSLILTVLACIYAPTMFIVVPVLMIQMFALFCHLIAYVPCARGAMNLDLGSIVMSSIFNRPT